MNVLEAPKSNHQAKVVRIKELLKHPNADTLSLVQFDGYQCVVKTVDWKEGQLAVYIVPDSIVPATPAFEFLWASKAITVNEFGERVDIPEKYRRIKSIRLRKEWSEGLLMPLSDFFEEPSQFSSRVQEGDDVADVLGITHYQPPEPEESEGQQRLPKGRWPRSLKGWFYFILSFFGFEVTRGLNTKGPSQEPPFYDVDAYKNHTNLFQEGEQVVVTEKIHGCVTNSTHIRMADGSQRKISKINTGDVVLGFENGRLVPSEVTNVFKNGKSEKWLKVVGKRKGLAGRGNHYFSVHCTPEHMFFNPDTNEYKLASDLSIGDAVLASRTDLGLSPVQEQVILGKLLGDGSLCVSKATAAVFYGHKEADREYLEWTAQGLGEISSSHIDKHISGYGTTMFRRSTIGSFWVKNKFESFVDKTEKHVPKWVADELTPLALAFWYMDDGSLSSSDEQEDRATFAVCGFNADDCDVLLLGLKKLGITADVKNWDGYNRIVVNTENAERLFLLVAPYVPPSMQRKLPKRYRGGSGWLPTNSAAYKPSSVILHISEINDVTKQTKSKRFDIETKTHNYFANNILTHNSNARFTFQDGKFYVGSRKLWKSKHTKCIWRSVSEQYPEIEQWCREHEGYVLYGEVVPCQKFKNGTSAHYGAKDGLTKFFLFDILSPSEEWVSYEELGQLLKDDLSLVRHYVPILYEGPFDTEKIKSLVDGKSLVADHIREGVVIKPVKERRVPGFGRLQLKIVSNEFLNLT